MENRIGTVTEVYGGTALVDLSPQPACLSCARGAGCGLGPLLALFGRHRRQDRLEIVASGLRAGERVRLSLPPSVVARAAGRGYLVPIVLMFTGTLAASALVANDAAAIAGALAGLLLAQVALRGRRRRAPCAPMIVERL